ITVSASASAYLQEAVADFRGVAAVGALDQTMVAQGQGSFASVGPTASVPAGELVVAAVLTGGQPGWVLPGSSQRVPYVLDVQNGSSASDLEDILSSAAGPQDPPPHHHHHPHPPPHPPPHHHHDHPHHPHHHHHPAHHPHHAAPHDDHHHHHAAAHLHHAASDDDHHHHAAVDLQHAA